MPLAIKKTKSEVCYSLNDKLIIRWSNEILTMFQNTVANPQTLQKFQCIRRNFDNFWEKCEM